MFACRRLSDKETTKCGRYECGSQTVTLHCAHQVFLLGNVARREYKHEYEFIIQFGTLECFYFNSVLIKSKH